MVLRENPNWEKTTGGEKSTIIRRFTRITGMYWDFIELGSDRKKKPFGHPLFSLEKRSICTER